MGLSNYLPQLLLFGSFAVIGYYVYDYMKHMKRIKPSEKFDLKAKQEELEALKIQADIEKQKNILKDLTK